MTLRALPFVIGLAVIVLPGCGGPTLAPVKGRVTFKGKPVPDAALTFAPVPKSDKDKEPGKPADHGKKSGS